jgi:hypothetical protein
MKPEAQQIAIAKACGWTHYHADLWVSPNVTGDPNFSELQCEALPAYLTDLNAMHEAEKTLDPDQLSEYCQHLFVQGQHYTANSIGMYEAWTIGHATATQRAEAFLRTLNLWTD